MDQLKPVIEALKKYYFWILTLLAVIAASGVFYMASSDLNQTIDSRIAAIDSSYQKVSTVSSKAATHPNRFSQEEMEKEIAKHKEEVRAAWQLQYDRQKEFLTWPQNVTTDRAIRVLDAMRPIELKIDMPLQKDPLFPNEREQYRNYIERVFPKIADTIDTEWSAPTFSGNPNVSVRNNRPSLVNWSATSQEELQKEIVPWFDKSKPPSTIDILYTQEDLWILQGILNVIARVNGDARENFQAAIKEISWIRIGATANGAAGTIEELQASNQLGGGQTAAAGGGGSSIMPGTRDPAHMRYVDPKFKPIGSSTLVSGMKSGSAQDAYMVVAKRIPIQLRVKMDQRRIPELIAACGNNELVIDVKQVRIGTEESAKGEKPKVDEGGAGLGGGMGGGGGPGGAYGGGYGAEGDGGDMGNYGGGGAYGDSGYGTGGSGGITWEEKPFELDVEVYGIVLLYNPVDIDKLGIEAPAEPEAVPAASPAPAQPATVPGEPPVTAAPPVAANPDAAAVVGNPPAGQPPADTAPADTAPADTAPADTAPADTAPADSPPVGEPPAPSAVEEVPAGAAPQPPAVPPTDNSAGNAQPASDRS